MFIVVFASRDVPEALIEKRLRDKHAEAEISLIPVKHATSEQITQALAGKQYAAVYIAELGNGGEVIVSDLFTASAVPAELAATVRSRLTTPNSVEPDGVPARRTLRLVLDRLFPTPLVLDAFILDHFPQVWRQLAPQMERLAKTTLLLSMCQPEQLLKVLASQLEFETYRHLVVYELPIKTVWKPAASAQNATGTHEAAAANREVVKKEEKGVQAPAPRVMVFAPRSALEEAIHDDLRKKHPTAEIGLIAVKHATRVAIRDALGAWQPNVVYIAESTSNGDLGFTDISQGRLEAMPAPHPKPSDPKVLDALADTLQRHLTTPNSEDPDGPPTRSSVRKLIELLFPSHAELESFIAANYPHVAHRLSPQMERTAKVNLLLQIAQVDDLVAALAKNSEFATHRHCLTHEVRFRRIWRPESDKRETS